MGTNPASLILLLIPIAVLLSPCPNCSWARSHLPRAVVFNTNFLEMKAWGCLCHSFLPSRDQGSAVQAEQPVCLSHSFLGMVPLASCAHSRGQQVNIWKVRWHCHLSFSSRRAGV